MDLYTEALEIIGDNITYLQHEGLFNWGEIDKHQIPLSTNKYMRDLDDLSDKDRQDTEFMALVNSRDPFCSICEKVISDGVTKLYSPFGQLGADICMFIYWNTSIPFFFNTHAYDLFCMKGYKKLKSALAKRIFTISEYNKKYIIDNFGVSGDKVIIKRVNYSDIKPNMKRNDIPLFEYIFSAGRLIEMKGYKHSITAFKKLHDKYPEVHYIIAGCGTLDAELKQLVSDLDLGDFVHFVGHVENKIIMSYIQYASLSILASTTTDTGDKEGLPTFFIESMSMGTPCIGTNYSGIPEIIIDGVTGYTTNEGDVDMIFDRMDKIYDLDILEYMDMSDECVQMVNDNFSNDKNIKKMVECFK
jgi:glycosyltransferase involved in cell wall biosynthesis